MDGFDDLLKEAGPALRRLSKEEMDALRKAQNVCVLELCLMQRESSGMKEAMARIRTMFRKIEGKTIHEKAALKIAETALRGKRC